MRTLTSILMLSLIACSHSGTAPSASTTTQIQSHHGGKPAAPLDADDITKNQYVLLEGLSFSGAQLKKYTMFPGTDLETKVVRRSYFFANQHPITAEEAKSHSSYCEIYAESNSDADPGRDISLSANQKLLVGELQQSTADDQTFFSLTLQGPHFQQFQLACTNTVNAAEVRAHVGQILQITKD